jgi:hypothetical protein
MAKRTTRKAPAAPAADVPAAPAEEPKKSGRSRTVEMNAPAGVGSFGTVHGTFDVKDGKVSVPEEAVADALLSGFTVVED